jgi:diacylglycerol kinase family enzyme
MAQIDDGVFEVIDMGQRTKVAFAAANSSIYSGKHLDKRGVRHFRCQKISLEIRNREAAHKFLLDVDGEPLGALPVEIEVVPKALPVLVSP